ncbi:Inactive terpenoid synthase 20 [Arabidopsis thaliana]
MEAITKNGSLSQTLVHCGPKSLSSFIPVRCLRFSKNPFPKKLVVTRARTSINSDHEAANRPLFQFPPSLLDDRFLSISANQSPWRDIEALKAKVSEKLVCMDVKERIHLIHLLVSLGVAYHFEKQIEEFLKVDFENVEDMNLGEEDMYSISVIFRVFRLYRHKLSSDVFNRFKEENGDFKKCLLDDVRGMLSFYEASYFGTNTEEILDEAMGFTRKHLELFCWRQQ